MRKLGKRLALLLLTACMAAGEAPMAVWAETTEAAEEIPPVHEMDDDNEYVRIVIGKTHSQQTSVMGLVIFPWQAA